MSAWESRTDLLLFWFCHLILITSFVLGLALSTISLAIVLLVQQYDASGLSNWGSIKRSEPLATIDDSGSSPEGKVPATSFHKHLIRSHVAYNVICMSSGSPRIECDPMRISTAKARCSKMCPSVQAPSGAVWG